jgi:predicted ATPase
MHLGEFAPSIEHFEKALSLYDPGRHLDDAFLYAQNPGVAMPCFAAWSLWFLGQPDRALERISEALSLARALSEPHGLAHALLFASILHQLRGEEERALEQAEAAIALSREHGLVLYEATATVIRAWSLSNRQSLEEVIEQMRWGLAALPAGTQLVRPHFLGLLAEALAKNGKPGEALQLLDEALALAHRNGERYYEAELHRLKGETLLLQSTSRSVLRNGANGNSPTGGAAAATCKAEACFHQSIETARRQRARSWELRAVTSLARLYAVTGRTGEGRTRLRTICDAFAEGFDTADLRDAKALIARLA